MSSDRGTPHHPPGPSLRERCHALQWACQGLQQHARELRREANLALEQSRQVRADIKLFLPQASADNSAFTLRYESQRVLGPIDPAPAYPLTLT